MRSTPPSSLGSARSLLVMALALAAAVLVGSVVLMALRDDEGGGASSDGENGKAAGAGVPCGRGTRAVSAKSRKSESDADDVPGDEWHQPGADSRMPEGDVFVIDENTLRAELKAGHWEELRRQIDDLQREKKPIPADVVKALIEMLGQEDLRLDAVLALGGIKNDDETGRLLAQLALAPDASLAVRESALQALAKSGQKGALPYLQQLVAAAPTEGNVMHDAIAAVGAVGGADAAKTLIDLLARHADPGDELRGVIVAALGKSHDADGTMAATLRAARDAGDASTLTAIVVASQMQATAVGPEVKTELQHMVEGAGSLSAFTDENDRLRIQGAVLYAAAAAGVVAPVIQVATNPGPMRDAALEALTNAHGDSAAKQIVKALAAATDPAVRWKLVKALGATASKAATSTLVGLLDDSDVNVRNLAATGLGEIRDADAVPALLSHLGKAGGDYAYAHGLVDALGRIGQNSALPDLKQLAASDDPFWRDLLRPFLREAIHRIESDNPDSKFQPEPK